jgi:hypothetical protein
MFDSSIIGTIVGLLFVFSLMAILVTYINNAVNSLLNVRARTLKSGLKTLLTDETLQAKILAHPLINMVEATLLTEDPMDEATIRRVINSPTTRVSYIAPETFVEALKSILLTEAQNTLFARLAEGIDEVAHFARKSELRERLQDLQDIFTEDNLRRINELIEMVPNADIKARLRSGLADVETTIRALDFRSGDLVALAKGIEQINDPRLRSALQAVLRTARSMEDAERKLMTWFNDSMNRVTEVFKRNIQRFSLFSAFLLALLFNVDTLYLARTLYEDRDLREAVVTAALATDLEAMINNAVADPDGDDPATDPEADPGVLDTLDETGQDAREVLQILLDLQLPIGWQYVEVSPAMVEQSQQLGLSDPRDNGRNVWNYIPGNTNDWLWSVFQKFFGILLTTIAAAQGAPYWFDLFNRLTTRQSST